jgi:hypothetical protein
MTITRKFTEDQLVEQPAVELFVALGWETVNAYHETFGPEGMLGRTGRGEVILTRDLRAALERLNPDLPTDAVQKALDALTRDRSAMSIVQANRELYTLVREGVKLVLRERVGDAQPRAVRTVRQDHGPQSPRRELLRLGRVLDLPKPDLVQRLRPDRWRRRRGDLELAYGVERCGSLVLGIAILWGYG